MRELFVVLCVICCASQVTGQQIVGRILDKLSGKPVADVQISIEGDSIVTFSNYLGFFQITTEKENPVVLASHISYQDVKVTVGEQAKILFSMNALRKELPQLILTGFTEEKAYDIDSTELYEYEDYILDGIDTVKLVNNNARFNGGAKGLFNYVGRHLKYDSSYEKGISVVVNFTVDKNGIVKDVITSGDTLNGFGEKIQKVFLEMPEWRPAKQGKLSTYQYFVVEILFDKEIFLVVEETATFPGGMNALYEFIAKQMTGKYPREARRLGIEGKVFVQFVVERDGTIPRENISIMEGIGGGCDELAMSVIEKSSPWTPASIRGKPVRQRMVFPIFFKLN